jgi:hypothetical protein
MRKISLTGVSALAVALMLSLQAEAGVEAEDDSAAAGDRGTAINIDDTLNGNTLNKDSNNSYTKTVDFDSDVEVTKDSNNSYSKTVDYDSSVERNKNSHNSYSKEIDLEVELEVTKDSYNDTVKSYGWADDIDADQDVTPDFDEESKVAISALQATVSGNSSVHGFGDASNDISLGSGAFAHYAGVSATNMNTGANATQQASVSIQATINNLHLD